MSVNAIFLLAKGLAWSATIAIMLGGALRLGPASLWKVREQPALFLRTLAGVWIAVPALTILVILALGVHGLSATMLLLMAICPGMPVLLGTTRSVRGALGTAFVALLLTATTEPLLIPYWTRLLSVFHPTDLTVKAVVVLRVLVPTVFLPVAVGFLIRAIWPRAATLLARACDLVYLVGIILDVIVVLIQGAPVLHQIPLRAYLATLVLTEGDALIGYWVGWPNRDDQKAIAVAAAMGNPALALAVVETSFPGIRAVAIIAAYLLVRTIAMAPLELWLKSTRRPFRPRPGPDQGRTPPGPARSGPQMRGPPSPARDR